MMASQESFLYGIQNQIVIDIGFSLTTMITNAKTKHNFGKAARATRVWRNIMAAMMQVEFPYKFPSSSISSFQNRTCFWQYKFYSMITEQDMSLKRDIFWFYYKGWSQGE
ncbi:hypothetical protein RIF29_39351 [Crotalaria pallida]|uniref:Uncharacterized protein n=1 Tax=Crotalaria pallida TaxID=3830 RepID=A0AAN9E132_CROPI